VSLALVVDGVSTAEVKVPAGGLPRFDADTSTIAVGPPRAERSL
jgi:hypothetical protein